MEVLGFINDNILWGIPLIVAIMGTGILLSIRTKFLQVRKFKESLSSTIVPTVKSMIKPDKQKKGGKGKKTVSQFEAFSTAISGTVGTGNIVGVAGALIAGGPGAIFWMWVSAFFGLVTNYSENVLGLYFRKKDKDGEISGGPMYYISNGLKCKWLGLLFAAFCGFAAVGMGMVQSNTISETLQSTIAGGNAQVANIVAWVVAIVIAVLLALIVIGGIKRIGKVASLIVPFMALLFLVMALIVICMNITVVPAAFVSIVSNAFSFEAVGGGVTGYAITLAMRYGFARGVFSNEAGLGSSVIAHSASDTKEPVQQGLWGIFEVFLDTFIICTITALSCIIVSGNAGIDFANVTENGDLVKSVIASSVFVDTFGAFGSIVFSIILPLFAFTTILAWSYYGQKSIEYLFGEKIGKIAGNVFKVLYVILVAVGCLAKSDFVWLLDDMFNALMALPNLIGLIGLSGLVVKISKNYFDRKAGKDVEAMLSAYPERNAELIAELKKEEEEAKAE